MKITQEKAVIILGVWLFILPATGFPHAWKSWLTALTGIAIVYLGALLWRKARMNTPKHAETKTGTFTETA